MNHENGSRDISQMRTWIVMILVALVSGGSGSYLSQSVNPPRPDPFTGQDATKLESRINTRMTSLEEQHNSLMQMTIQIITDDARMHERIENINQRCNKAESKLEQVFNWVEPTYKRKK